MSSITEERAREIFAAVPPTPEGAEFRIVKVDTVVLPHPFVITPKHLAGDSMYLNEDVIERSGAPCGHPGCLLGIREHESQVTLFVEVEDNRVDLNTIDGLGPYLQAVKDADLGLEGFAFPDRRTR